MTTVSQNTPPKNYSRLAEVLNRLESLLDGEFSGILAGDTIWNIILGVLPVDFEGHEGQIMKLNRKDTTAEKIENIERLTEYAEYFIAEKPDFNFSNLGLFSQVLGQLKKYASGDHLAEVSINRMNDLYISYISSQTKSNENCHDKLSFGSDSS